MTGLANVCLCCMCVDTSFEICGHLPIFIGITTQQGGDTGVTTHARTAMADAPHAVPVWESGVRESGASCARAHTAMSVPW